MTCAMLSTLEHPPPHTHTPQFLCYLSHFHLSFSSQTDKTLKNQSIIFPLHQCIISYQHNARTKLFMVVYNKLIIA